MRVYVFICRTLETLEPGQYPLIDANAIERAGKLSTVLDRSLPLMRRVQRMRDNGQFEEDAVAIVARKYLKAISELEIDDGGLLLCGGWWYYANGQPNVHNILYHIERTAEV